MDLKVIDSVLTELEEDRGIARDKAKHAIEEAFAHAYKKEYGKRGQVVRATLDLKDGSVSFEQVKKVVDDTMVEFRDESEVDELQANDEQEEKRKVAHEDSEEGEGDEDTLPYFDPEKHMLIEDARKIRADVELGDEITFPLEEREDFGRIAAQTAKQVLIQNIREAEKSYLSREFGEREGEIVTGSVQRMERGNTFVDLGRATGVLPYEEQIPGERYRQGERIRAYLYRVEETPRGVFLKLSRSHPAFLEKLFELEAPEVANEVVEIKAIAREAGSRSKVAVHSNDEHIDPVGALVGQRGVRVSTVTSELGGEKIDIVEWSEDPVYFIEDALSPAKVIDVEIVDEELHQARVTVVEDQQSLAIGRGGQNVRLAAKLTGWRIDIQSATGETVAEASEEGDVEVKEDIEVPEETVVESEPDKVPEETVVESGSDKVEVEEEATSSAEADDSPTPPKEEVREKPEEKEESADEEEKSEEKEEDSKEKAPTPPEDESESRTESVGKENQDE